MTPDENRPALRLRIPFRGLLALVTILAATGFLLRGGGLSAQTPPALPSPTVLSGLTNVGTVYYVDNGIIDIGPGMAGTRLG